MEAAVRLDVGTQRTFQEDAAGAFPELGLALVADGMGGNCAGTVASSMVLEGVPRDLRPWLGMPWPPGRSWSDHPLATAIELASLAVFEASSGQSVLSGMGSTVAALLEVDGGVLVAHVGDSRVYRLRERRLELLTADHSLVNDYHRLVSEGSLAPLTAEQVAALPRNVITRAVGAAASLQVDVRHEPLAAGDLFLLCSDGLTVAVDDATIATIVARAGDLEAAADRLCAASNEGGGPDNIAVVLVRWG